jgi:1-acyl-sn-glycerol-3-phosphate acyltransferase
MFIKLILFIIIYIIFSSILFLIPKYIIKEYIGLLNYIGLNIIGFNTINCNNLNLLKKIVNSDEKVIIICNHRSLLDSLVLLSLSDGHISFLFNEGIPSKIPFLIYILENYTDSLLNKSINKVESINKHVKKRKKGDPILCIFADNLDKIEETKNIAFFKTGAFVNKFKILPIIIKYKNNKIDNTFIKCVSDPLLNILNLFLGENGDIIMDVMDIVECKKEWTINQYKDYVYDLMNKKYSIL